jgi:signal transduction histidine kinase
MTIPRPSLFWKIWLSTSVALTTIFILTGWVVQRDAALTTSRTLEEEVQGSFQAYESLWRMRAETLSTVASILSSMPNVRAAFGTRDPATIRDTAREMWSRISDSLKETALFLVTDPQGRLLASMGEAPTRSLPKQWPVVAAAASKFPQQASGFHVQDGTLYQLVITPVYVDSARGPALITVLVAGYEVNHLLAQRLKDSTGGSDFLFVSNGRVFASTLNDRATRVLAQTLGHSVSGTVRISDGVSEYTPLVRELIDIQGKPIGQLSIFRSFETARQHIAALTRNVIFIWLLSVSVGLVLTYMLARRIVGPVRELDRAAAEVARQNYSYRVSVDRKDELGRLAATFNSMSESLQSARAELIRQERISTIGRMASSIVHDLRNPLAAIYGGAEMMVDTELSPDQMKRLASNIYRASRRIQVLLQDLVDGSRGKSGTPEPCYLGEVIGAAMDSLGAATESQGVTVRIDVPEDLEAPMDRTRIERVFTNVVQNALEMMPEGGEIRISARLVDGAALAEVEDTGPGISPEAKARLFEPFASFGKKGGMGLGLALSRQAVLEHGGDLWAAEPRSGRGARFMLRFPNAVSHRRDAESTEKPA